MPLLPITGVLARNRSLAFGRGVRLAIDHLTIGHITVELTRRRESKHRPPDKASYETRPRRSRPTICYTARDYQDSFFAYGALHFVIRRGELIL